MAPFKVGDPSQVCDASSLSTLDTVATAGTFTGQWQGPFNQIGASVAEAPDKDKGSVLASASGLAQPHGRS